MLRLIQAKAFFGRMLFQAQVLFALQLRARLPDSVHLLLVVAVALWRMALVRLRSTEERYSFIILYNDRSGLHFLRPS